MTATSAARVTEVSMWAAQSGYHLRFQLLLRIAPVMNRYFRPYRILRCAVLLLLSLPFLAFGQKTYDGTDSEWISLGRTDRFRVYLDQRSAQRDGDLTRVYQLTDFVTAQWVDERTVVGSIRALVEYDCTQPRLRTIALEAYSEQMGEGQLVTREQNPEAAWENIPSEGTGENVRKMVCKK
jgi:hypothetical protein